MLFCCARFIGQDMKRCGLSRLVVEGPELALTRFDRVPSRVCVYSKKPYLLLFAHWERERDRERRREIEREKESEG